MKKKNNRKNIWKDSRFYFVLVQTILSAALLIQLFLIHILPMKYFIALIAVLLVLLLLMWALQYGKGINKLNRTLGKIMIVLLSGLLIFANVYVFIGGNTLGAITGQSDLVTEISVVVMKEDQAETITDLKNDSFGVLSVMDQENTTYAVEKINEDLDGEISSTGYQNIAELSDALYQGEVRAIVLNESYRSMIEETHEKFSDETKVLKTYKRVSKAKDFSKNVDVTEHAFNIYVSGNDRYGSINTGSRSDVNIIMTINPVTKKVLMTSIPRDYYVRIPCYENEYDKLTHAGNGGVQCSVEAVEQKLGIDINYYVRVNFTSLIEIVDVLDGVDVEVANSFSADGYQFNAGTQHMDGKMALAFARDRYHQEGGDRGRGENQMRVMTAIINKALSYSIITNYTGIMNVVGGSFETNMSDSKITSLVRMQLNDMSGWTIESQSVDGTGASLYSYQNGTNSYMMVPDEESVAAAVAKIEAVMKEQ